MGALLLLQYTGDPVAALRASGCAVAECTIAQIFASVLLPVDEEAVAAFAGDPLLEPWERGYAAACLAFVRGEFEESVRLCAANLGATWRDAFSARLIILAALFAGDVGAALGPLSAASAARAAAEGGCGTAVGALLAGLEAFALEEAGRPGEARACAEAAIAATARLNAAAPPPPPLPPPLTAPFAVHALCHVYESAGEPAAGLAALDGFDPGLWAPCALLAPHIWWHRALFQLDGGEEGGIGGGAAAALETYRAHLADPPAGDPFALSDASGLLLRVWALRLLPPATEEEEGGGGGEADAVRAFVAGELSEAHGRWSAYGGARAGLLRRTPFFFAHAELVRGVVAGVPGGVHAGAPPGLLVATPLSDGSSRRAAFCDAITGVAESLVRVASAAPEERAAAAGRVLDAFLAGGARGAASAPVSASAVGGPPVSSLAVTLAAFSQPMGGSIAQRDVLARLAVAAGTCAAAGAALAPLSEATFGALGDHLLRAASTWPRVRFHSRARDVLRRRLRAAAERRAPVLPVVNVYLAPLPPTSAAAGGSVFKVVGADATVQEYAAAAAAAAPPSTSSEWAGVYLQFTAAHALGCLGYRWERGLGVARLIEARAGGPAGPSAAAPPILVTVCSGLSQGGVSGEAKAAAVRAALLLLPPSEAAPPGPLMAELARRRLVLACEETAGGDWELVVDPSLLDELLPPAGQRALREYVRRPDAPVTLGWREPHSDEALPPLRPWTPRDEAAIAAAPGAGLPGWLAAPLAGSLG